MTHATPSTERRTPARIAGLQQALRSAARLGIGPALQFAGPDGGLPEDGAPVPDWVQLLPGPDARGHIHTRDGRGPYRIADAAALVADALAEGPLPIDEAHATDLQHGAAPAMGWIVEMAVRDGAVWGRVEWTRLGRVAVASRHYRALSPVFAHEKDGTVTQLLRAGLVNNPNLRGLAALNATHPEQEEDGMSFHALIAERLGLEPTVGEEAILAALPDRAALQALPALQSALGEAATALGVDAAKPAAVASAARVIAAQAAQVAALQGRLSEIEDARAQEAAEAWFDAALAEGRAVTVAARESWIAMHRQDPKAAEAMMQGVGLGPIGRSHASAAPPAGQGAAPQSAREIAAAAQAKVAEAAAQGRTLDYLDAVALVSKG